MSPTPARLERDHPPGGSRRVVALAWPALGVLAAEPLYLLVDTAVVGHLGTVPLSGLAVAGSAFALLAVVGNFLAYGTTGRAARHHGAGDDVAAVAEGVTASWLAVGLAAAVIVAGELAAGPVTRTLAGGAGPTTDAAEQWLRVALLGSPGVLLALAGNGWMRGVEETRRPLSYVLAANALSAVLCPLLVHTAGLGLVGSALANVAAQSLVAVLFARALLQAGVPLRPRPDLVRAQLRVARDLVVRTVALQAAVLSAAAVAARMGAAQVAAHQIALQLWFFLALVLDAFAIAAQTLVGGALGAGRTEEARAVSALVARLGGVAGAVFGGVLLAGWEVVPRLFTGDADVIAQAHVAWPWFAGMQPVAGVLFALDGVLVGAGDVAYLRSLTVVAAAAGFLPLTWLSLALDLGLGGVWAGLTLFLVLRLVGMLARVRGDRWLVTGVRA